MSEQTEKSYQRPHGCRSLLATKSKLRKNTSTRYYKSVGLGFKTPQEAIEGTYIDKKCPFTSSNVSVRGRLLKGVVKTAKMKRTIIVRRDYLHYIRKYNRYEKRHKNFAAHLTPAFRVAEGDQVTVGECRPLSKTVRYNVVQVTAAAGAGKGVKLFNKF